MDAFLFRRKILEKYTKRYDDDSDDDEEEENRYAIVKFSASLAVCIPTCPGDPLAIKVARKLIVLSVHLTRVA